LDLYAVYQATGISLVHSSAQATDAINAGGEKLTSESSLEPGDLVFFGGSFGDFIHSGIYAGDIDGKPSFISAVTEGVGVSYETMAWEEAANGFVGGVRLGGSPNGPSAPSSLTATTDHYNSATLEWSASSGGVGGVTSYKIIRNGFEVASVSAGSESYQDTAISPGMRYVYWVVAVDTAGNDSAESPAVTVGFDQKGQGSFELAAKYGPTYCRQVGSGPNNVQSYLKCTVFNGTTWTDHLSGVEDWGTDTGWAWVSDHGNPAYCRQVGSGPNNVQSYLKCTVFNGTTWTDHLSGVEDWGYPVQLSWLSSALPLQRPQLSSSHAVRGHRLVATLTESGGAAPFVWFRTTGSLPRGLTLTSSGVISGTPQVVGTFHIGVVVRDTAWQTASATITIKVGS
jgi:hypothetical protein